MVNPQIEDWRQNSIRDFCADYNFIKGCFMAIVNLTQDDLIAFEDRVADAFNDAKIPAPVHLYSNNEQKMIEVFKEINENDWVFVLGALTINVC